jgi:hypothetical protein
MSGGIAGTGINLINKPLENRVDELKETSHYQSIKNKLAAEKALDKGIWVKTKDKTGEDYFLDIAKLTTKSYFTTVKTHEGVVKVPLLVKMIMGEKIGLRDKIEGLIEAYSKAVVQTTSHNLLMSRIAGMKMASLAFVLSLLGIPAEELKKLKKQALEDAAAENLALFEENSYNMELLEIIGGSRGRKLKAERSVLTEIQTQLITQAKRLNLADYYTKERIMEIQIRSCKDILYKFREEEQNIQYELDYYLTTEQNNERK